MHLARDSRPRANRRGDFGHNIGVRPVSYGVNGIQPQTIEAILLDPVQRVVYKKVAHRAAAFAVKVDRGTPGRTMRRIEELGTVGVKVVPFRAEMVVNDVE